MWSSWNQALQARCWTSASATALMTMSLYEIFSGRASRASAARSMSISVVRKKCGIGPIDAASRLAIVFRIWVRGTSSYGTPDGARSTERGAGAALGCPVMLGLAAPASTSRLMTRPPGPDPCTSFRSTPASLAIRRASGDAFTRVASVAVATGAGAGAGFGAGFGAAAAGAGFAAPCSVLPAPSTFSPGLPIHETPLLHRGRERLHVNFGGHGSGLVEVEDAACRGDDLLG